MDQADRRGLDFARCRKGLARNRALILVPAGEFGPHAQRCLAYCEKRGCELAGIVRGDWDAVIDVALADSTRTIGSRKAA